MGTWNSPAQVPNPPTFQYGTPSGDEQMRAFYEYVKKIANVVSALRNDLEFAINGKLDSENIREIAGYNVDKTVLKHKSGIVGMNGADPQDPNAIRFWAGNADPNQAPFRVQQDGTMYATDGNFTGDITGSTITGSKIQTSANSYPRIELTSTDQLLAAYRIATDFIKFHSQLTGSPTIEFENGTNNTILSAVLDTMIINALRGDIQIVSQSGQVKFSNWSNIYSMGNNQTLQQALTNVGSSGGASTIINQNLTPNRAVVSDSGGKVVSGSATNTEISYLSGVTSNIQTQLNSKVTSLSGGAKIQSGTGTITITTAGTQVTKAVNFGTSFSSAPTSVICTYSGGLSSSSGYIVLSSDPSTWSTSGFTVFANAFVSGTAKFSWIAVGS
ncbi:hypothetical protein [Paenibacillus oleatilyticus]|uniref:Tail fiber protein n=1 Tax=Paenibacillus oleatilyticus TaxID=2594886 RepID=A0ABV4VCH1_9BACL